MKIVLIAQILTSDNITALMTSDSGEEALTMMNIYHVRHLPIVNNQQLLGTISDEDIYGQNMNEAIGSYSLNLAKTMVAADDHIFEVMSVLAKYNLTTVPVVDQNENYIGLITQQDLLQYYANSFSFSEPGSILVIKSTKINYSLAEISRIVEEESATVLSTFITEDSNHNAIFVTIKVNTSNIQNIIASLQRYDYEVTRTFTENEYIDTLKERYDALMSYLNV